VPAALARTHGEVQVLAERDPAKADVFPRLPPDHGADVVHRWPGRLRGACVTRYAIVRVNQERTEKVGIVARNLLGRHCRQPRIAFELGHEPRDRVALPEHRVLNRQQHELGGCGRDRAVARLGVIELGAGDRQYLRTESAGDFNGVVL
jgi:hypothetical protein